MPQLSLHKYGLSYIENIDITDLPPSDVDLLLKAYINEGIAPTIPGLEFTQEIY
jgi:hypothetical protein